MALVCVGGAYHHGVGVAFVCVCGGRLTYSGCGACVRVCVETVLGLELLPSEPYLNRAGPDGVRSGHPAGYKCFLRRFGLTCVPLK